MTKLLYIYIYIYLIGSGIPIGIGCLYVYLSNAETEWVSNTQLLNPTFNRKNLNFQMTLMTSKDH